MTYLPHTHTALARPAPPLKRRRRTATSVLAGDYDYRPPRDILTSLLNGVKPYRPPLTHDEIREKEAQKEKRREREKLNEVERERRKKEKLEQREKMRSMLAVDEMNDSYSKSKHRESHGPKDFWTGRPSTSSDVTPDDLSDHSSSVSQPSSKRPYTPPDEELPLPSNPGPSSEHTDLTALTTRKPGRPAKKKRVVIDVDALASSTDPSAGMSAEPASRREPKKRVAHKKGWKGWVSYDELGPDGAPSSTKLIELDRAIVLEDRRTRSGKNFDAISEGRDTWV